MTTFKEQFYSNQRLPTIRLKIGEGFNLFFSRARAIFENGSLFHINDNIFNNSNDRIVFEIESQIHRGLILQLIKDPREKHDRIRVSLNAQRWVPKHPPDYDTYKNALLLYAKPLLKKYNQTYRTKHRFIIPPKENLFEKLPPKARAAFHYFCTARQLYVDISESDWKNFYEFIRICHQTRVDFSDSDIIEILTMINLPEFEVHELADTYRHIRKYLEGYFCIFNNYVCDYKEYNKRHELV